MEQRLSYITLGVADLDRSEAFYRALGWTPSKAGVAGQIVFFQLNGVVLGLFPRAELAKDGGLADAPASGFGGITISHNVRTEAEVEAVIGEALAAGATMTRAPHTAAWGGRVAYFTDPDGHPWEVCYNPFSTLDEKGDVWLSR